MALQFTWEALWSFHDALEDQELKDFLQEEVVGHGWLYRQSAKEQKKVLTGAPQEFLKRIAKNLKPELQIEMGINPYV